MCRGSRLQSPRYPADGRASRIHQQQPGPSSHLFPAVEDNAPPAVLLAVYKGICFSAGTLILAPWSHRKLHQ